MTTPARIAVAALQCPLGDTDEATNIERVVGWLQQAAARKAQIVCLPELVEGPYFCQTQDSSFFARAKPAQAHPAVRRFAEVARAHAMVVAVPFFEQDGPHYYNSVVVLDADGTPLRHSGGGHVYRKSHIPQGPGYEEKYYFRPGNTGFVTWPTAYGCIGVGICWDQWFPEAARSMALQGADILLYPTAIGSEPTPPHVDTQPQWQLAMQGHAVCNKVAVVAANRIGQEGTARFYGSSFVANSQGAVVAQLGRNEEGLALASLCPAEMRRERAEWGFFRDRRTDLYAPLSR